MIMLTASESLRSKRRAKNASGALDGACIGSRRPPTRARQGAAKLCAPGEAQAGTDRAVPREPARCLMQKAAKLRWLDRQLSELGAEILAEPIPDHLLRALSQLPRP